jgi:hypothetical protein
MKIMLWGLTPKRYFLISCNMMRTWQTYKLMKHKKQHHYGTACVAISDRGKLIQMSLPLKVDDLRLLVSLYTKKPKPSSITNAATTATPR